jgi:signal transduction histidine kinase
MVRAVLAHVLRALAVAAGVLAVVAVLAGALAPVLRREHTAVALPFLAAAVAAAGLGAVLPGLDRWVAGLTRYRPSTPYSALAQAVARIRAGSLPEALPGLARVLAEGTGATRAVLWLAVEDHLVAAAVHPPEPGTEPAVAANLAVVLAGPGADHVVPVLDGPVLRAVLAIAKPGSPITPADQQLMADVANGAGSLLREVQRGRELEQRVRRADELAEELQQSRRRLSRARDVERLRLAGELTNVTGDRLAALRAEFTAARAGLQSVDGPDDDVRETLRRARSRLDELLERFRSIARGVHPAVLRDQGPVAALEELVADLPRQVRLVPELPGRLAWEIESGVYYVVASALHQMTSDPGAGELVVRLVHGGGRLSARITDPTPGVNADRLRSALAIDVERLSALGGALELTADGAGIELCAWLPDRLEPLVDVVATRGETP